MKLLNRYQIAEMLAVSKGSQLAQTILEQHGVYPIDFGVGRSRGKRWLQSAVEAVIQQLHDDAQPKAKKMQGYSKQKTKIPQCALIHMSVNDIHALIESPTTTQ